jgi:hypothetical protein
VADKPTLKEKYRKHIFDSISLLVSLSFSLFLFFFFSLSLYKTTHKRSVIIGRRHHQQQQNTPFDPQTRGLFESALETSIAHSTEGSVS